MIINTVIRCYNHQFDILIVPFQPMVEDYQNLGRAQKYNLWAIPSLIFHVSIIIDIINQWLIDQNQYYHKVLLKVLDEFFVKLADYPCGAVYCLVIICSLFMLLEQYHHRDWILILRRDDKKLLLRYPCRQALILDRSLQQKLLQFYDFYRRRMKAFIKLFHYEVMISVLIPLFIYEFYLTITSNGQYLPGLRVVIVGLTSPYYVRCILLVINIGLQFIAQNRMIQIKNRHHQQAMNRKLNRLKSGNNQRDLQLFMRKLLDVSKEIRIFDRFYSRYVTSTIALLGFAGCAVLKGVLERIRELLVWQSFTWILFGVLYISYSYLFNAIASLTIQSNRRSFKHLRKLQISLTSGRCLSVAQTLKLDLINEYDWLLRQSTFRLLNSMTMNNRLFFFDVFVLLSFFYFKITLNF